jgi:hypothetical protein
VLRKHEVEDISTEAASGDRADQHVRIERDFHDTSRKTSSSVK